jgi:hypothetical protein
MARAGLKRGAIYLIRPDSYIAMVDPRGSAKSISAYLDKRNFRSSRQ